MRRSRSDPSGTPATTASTDEGLVPVTVIGGYLGAGKTTLINRLLRGDHGRRLAVLVNDFGEINIDAELIASHDGQTIGLTNGCVCCSIADALGEGLDQVLALDPAPEQIIIEASGVAEPGKVAAYGMGWPGCRLDATLVLADAETIRERAADRFVGDLVRRQLAVADLILVTKCDLLDRDHIDAVATWIETMTDAPLIRVGADTIDANLILEPRPAAVEVDPRTRPAGPDGIGPYQSTGLFESTGLYQSTGLFESTVLEVGPLERTTLAAALDRWPPSLVRIKGLAQLRDGTERRPRWHLVNRVGRRWSIEPMGEAPEQPYRGRLAVIALAGTLDRQLLAADLNPGRPTESSP